MALTDSNQTGLLGTTFSDAAPLWTPPLSDIDLCGQPLKKAFPQAVKPSQIRLDREYVPMTVAQAGDIHHIRGIKETLAKIRALGRAADDLAAGLNMQVKNVATLLADLEGTAIKVPGPEDKLRAELEATKKRLCHMESMAFDSPKTNIELRCINEGLVLLEEPPLWRAGGLAFVVYSAALLAGLSFICLSA